MYRDKVHLCTTHRREVGDVVEAELGKRRVLGEICQLIQDRAKKIENGGRWPKDGPLLIVFLLGMVENGK
jgi:hypothetical protein